MRENTLQLKLVSAATDVQCSYFRTMEEKVQPAADVYVQEYHKNQEKQNIYVHFPA